MKALILCSGGRARRRKDVRYIQKLDTRFARRVLVNLRGEPGACASCGPDCNLCRERYAGRFGRDIAGAVEFPAVLPYLLENPRALLPREVPPHDVILAVAIHEQILLEAARTCGRWGTRGIVVPLEAPDWISGAARAEIHRVCERQGVEVAFPKPFCAFMPPRGSVLARFREHFHVGRPDVKLTIEKGAITDAEVRVSAACGATYAVARWLAGRKLSENLEIEVISKRWHAFPCTASMERDPELDDETPLHVAGQAHYAILAPYKQTVAGLESPLVTSPLGKLVQRPIPPAENLARIDEAKAFVLDSLAETGSVTLRELRQSRRVSPAALNSALLILKREGRIRSDGARISRAPPV
ncbi:MAG: hypothetical protein FJ225_08375 [Lentisphaerae bacterium]|nr:hypothetical protein [Lentisphaerota bacterium]